MAGANNKAMKAAGLPKKTMDTARVALGSGMTVQSAIRHAQAHGLPLGKAAKHAGELTGWQKAAAGVKATPRAESPAATAAAKFRGAGPFNPERHKTRAQALATARKAQFAEADAKRTTVRDASDKEQANANRAYLKAGDAMDRADALHRRATDKLRAARMTADGGAEARKAALRGAMESRQRNLSRTLGNAGKGMLAQRKATQAASVAQKAAAAAKPQFKGAGPFNAERHFARADAALTKREDHAKQLKKRLDGLLAAKAPARDIAEAYTAHKKAAAAQDKAFDRYASAKERVDTAREAAARTSAAKQDTAGRAEMMQRSRAAIAAVQAASRFKGAGPFNPDRHKARAMALSDARKAQLKAAGERVALANQSEIGAARKAYNLAQRRADNAAALNRGASAKVSERDAVRRGEKGTMPVRMRQARADVAGLRAPGKGQAHIMTAEGPKVVDTVASSKNFFVHKEPGYGGQFVVSHRDTGMAITQSNTLSGAKRVMDGMKKTGHLTMRRLEQGGSAGERAARAMAKYLSAPKRRNVSLAERGLRAGSAPTKRGKEANAAAGIR